MAYILIFFAVFSSSSQSAVRVGFDSQATCVAAGKDTTAALKLDNPDAKVTWACVQQ